MDDLKCNSFASILVTPFSSGTYCPKTNKLSKKVGSACGDEKLIIYLLENLECCKR